MSGSYESGTLQAGSTSGARTRPFRALEITRRFESSYADLGRSARWQCNRAVRFLLEEPTHPSLDARPILPERVCWEANAGPEHRLVFRPEGDTAIVLDVIGDSTA